MKKILVVDDDTDILDIIKQHLTSHGFIVQTHSVGNLSEAIKWNQPNLIFLDIRFFGSYGIQICKELKEKYIIPIILLSSDTDAGNDYSNYNADDFIKKPFELSTLIETINLYLN